MSTSTEISFGLFDVTAKEDSAPTITDKQEFIDLEQLKVDDLQVEKYGTLEQNQFLLDGSFRFFPDDPAVENFGLWSLSMSGSTGVFLNPVVLTVTFKENHSSLGLTFRFLEATNDYCNSLNIKWYGSLDVLLANKSFAPDEPLYFAEYQVENYRKIIITFYSTNKPFRYLKLTELMYGALKIFGEDSLISANILEEANVLSSEISINTLNFKFHSSSGEFSILDMKGVFSLFQKKQWMKAVENVDGVKKEMGTYYLDEPLSESVNVTSMACIDILGIMDQTNFSGGRYEEVLASSIINDIMVSAGVEYELDTSYESATVSGYIPISTHKEALQQVAFALGAIVDSSRNDKVKMYPAPTVSTHMIGYSNKFDDHKIKQKALVTGVEVTAHKYVASADAQELFNGILSVGTHTITFSQAMHSLTVTGATISGWNANYAMLTVAVEGMVALSGKTYMDNKQVFGVYMPSLPANEKTNVLQIEDATLISGANAAAVAQRVYDYYQNRYEDTGSMILSDEEVGNMTTMDSQSNRKIQGFIESLEIDLMGGFIGKAKITGKVVE